MAQTDLATLQQERARDALLCFQNVLQLEQQAVDVLVAAGKAIVQLAAKHDQLVSPAVLFQLAVLLRHPDPTVRVGMLRKLHKSFERGQIALKFAALLPLSAVDPVKEYQQLAMATLKQVVKVRAHFVNSAVVRCCRQVLQTHPCLRLSPVVPVSPQVARARTQEMQARQAQDSADAAGVKAKNRVMVQMPEYIVLYLVSVLAHQTNSSAKPEAHEASQEILYFLLQVCSFPTFGLLQRLLLFAVYELTV